MRAGQHKRSKMLQSSLSEDISQAEYVYESTLHCQYLLKRLDEQRKQGILCDITVIVEGVQLYAHKAILAACSAYFNKIITDPDNINQNIVLELTCVDKIGIIMIMEFAYTSKLTLSSDNVDQVLLAARELQVENLESSCLNFLKKKLVQETDETSTKGSESTYQSNKISNAHAKKNSIKSMELEKPETFCRNPTIAANDEKDCVRSLLPDASKSLAAASSSRPKHLLNQGKITHNSKTDKQTDAKKTINLSVKPGKSARKTKAQKASRENAKHKTKVATTEDFVLPSTGGSAAVDEPPARNEKAKDKETIRVDVCQEMYEATEIETGVSDKLPQSAHDEEDSQVNENVILSTADNIAKDAPVDTHSCIRSSHFKVHERQKEDTSVINSVVDNGFASDGGSDTKCNEDTDEPLPTKSENSDHTHLPLSEEELVNMSHERLDELINSQSNLSMQQVCAIHDMRRKAKNKVAALKCRKRKIDYIRESQCVLENLRNTHNELMEKRRCIQEDAHKLIENFHQRYKEVFDEVIVSESLAMSEDRPVLTGGRVVFMAIVFKGDIKKANKFLEELDQLPLRILPPFTWPRPEIGDNECDITEPSLPWHSRSPSTQRCSRKSTRSSLIEQKLQKHVTSGGIMTLPHSSEYSRKENILQSAAERAQTQHRVDAIRTHSRIVDNSTADENIIAEILISSETDCYIPGSLLPLTTPFKHSLL